MCSGFTAWKTWYGHKLCPRKCTSLHISCNLILFFFKITAVLLIPVATPLLSRPFFFSSLLHLLLSPSYLFHTHRSSFLISYNFSYTSLFCIFFPLLLALLIYTSLIIVFLRYLTLENLHRLFLFVFVPSSFSTSVTFSAFILLLLYPKSSDYSTYFDSSSTSAPCVQSQSTFTQTSPTQFCSV